MARRISSSRGRSSGGGFRASSRSGGFTSSRHSGFSSSKTGVFGSGFKPGSTRSIGGYQYRSRPYARSYFYHRLGTTGKIIYIIFIIILVIILATL